MPGRWRESKSFVASPASTSNTSVQRPSIASHTGAETQDSTTATTGHDSHSHDDNGDGDGSGGDAGLGNTFAARGEDEGEQHSAGETTSSADSDGWVHSDRAFTEHAREGSPDADGEDSADENNGGGTGSSASGVRHPLRRIREWRQNQHELGLEHRGAMQAKPVRTAVWVKDKVEQGVHSVRDRFAMDAREPDVQTEV